MKINYYASRWGEQYDNNRLPPEPMGRVSHTIGYRGYKDLPHYWRVNTQHDEFDVFERTPQAMLWHMAYWSVIDLARAWPSLPKNKYGEVCVLTAQQAERGKRDWWEYQRARVGMILRRKPDLAGFFNDQPYPKGVFDPAYVKRLADLWRDARFGVVLNCFKPKREEALREWCFGDNGKNAETFTGVMAETVWARDMTSETMAWWVHWVKQLTLLGKDVWFHCRKVGQSDERSYKSAWLWYHLIAADNTYIWLGADGHSQPNRNRTFYDYAYDLGEPDGPAWEVDGVWRRQFYRGPLETADIRTIVFDTDQPYDAIHVE